jgi:hypothetical protein
MVGMIKLIHTKKMEEGSLTVEAAFVLPLFLYFILAFLYFIQIFMVQEYIQQAITRMSLDFAKTAYVYEDFTDITEAMNFDVTIFGNELELGLGDFTASLIDKTVLKTFSGTYLNADFINHSCVEKGFQGISFEDSSILKEGDCIDIVISYRAAPPIRLFPIHSMKLLQRVRVRGWTGREVAATYSMEEDEESEDVTVYITETGRVYHKSASCSHIRLSIRAVNGSPDSYRNSNGGKYYACKECCDRNSLPSGTFFITEDGSSYHAVRSCPALKRTVMQISLSKVGNRTPCKRCYTNDKKE